MHHGLPKNAPWVTIVVVRRAISIAGGCSAVELTCDGLALEQRSTRSVVGDVS